MIRVIVGFIALASSSAFAGELELNEVEQRLGIPYVQDRVVLDVHEELSFHGDEDRSYRNPAYENGWKQAYCHLVYWRHAIVTAKNRDEITVAEMKSIERALRRDQNDVKLENIDAYKQERSLFVRTRAEVQKHGLSACNG